MFNNIVDAKLGRKFLLRKFLCQFFSVFVNFLVESVKIVRTRGLNLVEFD